MNNKTYALILTVENKEAINNISTNLEKRFFEKESINCVKKWRKNGGWLKDIPIYIHCPSGKLSDETIEEYKKNDVFFIYKEIEDIKNFDYGFVNVHYSGLYFSNILKEDILIHIDLDMELLRPLDQSFFDPIFLNNYEAIIGGYSDIDYKNQRRPLFGTKLLNTDIIITTNKFSKVLYETIINSCVFVNSNKYNLENDPKFRIYDIEEYGADLAYTILNNKIYLLTEEDYEQGEGYYDNNLKNIPYFWHEHITSKLNTNLFLQKQKLKAIMKSNND